MISLPVFLSRKRAQKASEMTAKDWYFAFEHLRLSLKLAQQVAWCGAATDRPACPAGFT